MVRLFLSALALVLVVPLHAQILDGDARLKAWSQVKAMRAASPYKDLKWQWLGPANISGRATDIAVATPRGKTYTLYAATASSGLWKSENDGDTWACVFDQEATGTIGDVALAPSNPDIVWIGTGEANIFRSSQAGCGVYKSADGGKTWAHMGLANTHTIGRVVIHPKNPEVVYVAASGHEWTPNKERGVYRTKDGGKTWENVLHINEHAGAIDLVMDPKHPDTLYAATWERMRVKWNDPRNWPETRHSGIWKTTDGGKTWKPMNEGLPKPEHRGRIGLDVAASNPNVVYAFIDNYEIWDPPAEPKKAEEKKDAKAQEEDDAYGRPTGKRIKGFSVWRSENGGASWKLASTINKDTTEYAGTYGWVFGQIRVDPTNPNRVYAMGVPLMMSEDGGKTWKEIEGMHGDHHGLWIDPANPKYLVSANDGGVNVSRDGGKHWRHSVDIGGGQFFTLAVDQATPFRVYGSMQDHGSFRAEVDLRKGRDKVKPQTYEYTVGWEGGHHAIDPQNPDLVYGASFYGMLQLADYGQKDAQGGFVTKTIKPKKDKDGPELRGQWLAPFILSLHDAKTIYFGSQFVHRSKDRGATWERISDDLTAFDPKSQGDIPFHTLFTISESPLQTGLLYAGTDDGRLWTTKDDGKAWAEITAGLAPKRWMSRVVASSFDPNTVYLTQNGKRDDDFAAYVWKSVDQGRTWQSLAAGVPLGPVNVIREDTRDPKVLYLGTDHGVLVTTDGGQTWQPLGNLPSTYVHDLQVHPRDRVLVAATHGRGMWVLDLEPFVKARK